MSGLFTPDNANMRTRMWQQWNARLEYAQRSLGELMGYCDVTCERGHRVDGNVWYADRYLYPNHWQPGSKVRPKLVDDGQPHSWFNAWLKTTSLWVGILVLFFLLLLVFIQMQ
ncbi:uncharacterized protein TM35_000341200 [Trypanosoma theileri]|uniref:Uncharacterized protein n=1 Tax=Trypanosoma theileri TaxID=67003 RepID=A0A1X0NLU7_9TRYP|nr:uncharacterized protein TM35_000341200 [Trypanosoma theileri]ORC85508.1 hypothetical protein TM35_000341200 [Trypanosoma theileri]